MEGMGDKVVTKRGKPCQSQLPLFEDEVKALKADLLPHAELLSDFRRLVQSAWKTTCDLVAEAKGIKSASEK